MKTPPAADAPSKAALVTGCSSGIGRATAIHLASRGWPVYATARRLDSIADLTASGCNTLRLDLCDEASMQCAVEQIERKHGAVGVLVNNAGCGVPGAVEELALDEVRREFETNLFGPIRLAQLVLPAMRRQRWGKIVNLSSVGGRITTPGNSAYHASKHALESISDALRFEVHGFGIDVIVIEPGAIRTRWVAKVVRALDSKTRDGGPYACFDRSVAEVVRKNDAGLLALAAGKPEDVARVIERAITSRRPRTRYVVPAAAAVFFLTHRWLPDRVWDSLMRLFYPSPGEGAPCDS